MKRKTIKDPDMPIGKLTPIKDYLPPFEKLTKNLLLFCFLIILLNVCLKTSYTEEIKKPEPQKWELKLIYMLDEAPPKYIYLLGQTGFKSIESLKKFIGSLPQGTTIEWNPGCERMGDEPLLNDKKAMDDFKKYCEQHGIKLILIPSG